jgi:peptidoglycan-associated lipoprotein
MSISKLSLIAASFLVLAACSSKPDADGPDGPGSGQFGRNGQGGQFGAGGAGTPGSIQDFKVNVGDTVQFEEDSSDLTSQARGTLDKQSSWLQKYGTYTFIIEGHADERGTREYNLALGSRRAQTVRDYLAAKGIPTQRFRTISYGKERPVAGCDQASCWSQNRRGVTVIGQ